jgi:hypothetical protein
MMRLAVGWLLISFIWVHAQMDKETVDTRLPSSSVVAYGSVFELIRFVNGLAQLEQDGVLGFSSEQATAMLVVLEPLANEPNITPDLATQTTASLLSRLSTEQLALWEELTKTQEKLFQKRSAQIRTQGTFTIYNVVVPGYSSLRGLVERGEAFNPFHLAPNSETLTAFITTLQNAQ